MTLVRDPVSITMDRAARALLMRAYRSPGAWVATRVKDPSPAAAGWWLARHGINVTGRDVAGSGRARTRWARAFTRACYYQHQYWWNGQGGQRAAWREARRMVPVDRPLQVDVGAAKRALGVIPAGRAVRVRVPAGGAAAARAVAALPNSERIYTAGGHPGGAHSAAGTGRDWA